MDINLESLKKVLQDTMEELGEGYILSLSASDSYKGNQGFKISYEYPESMGGHIWIAWSKKWKNITTDVKLGCCHDALDGERLSYALSIFYRYLRKVTKLVERCKTER